MSNTWTPFQKPNPNRPSHHTNNDRSSFRNPWPSASPPTWTEILQSSFPLSLYPNLSKKHPDIRDVKVVVPDWGEEDLKARGPGKERDECIVATTLGHAGVMVQVPLEGTMVKGEGEGEKDDGKWGKERLWVVFDPIFSARAGPTQYTGPGRLRRAPCQVEDFPGCDAVVISHNHYDHLDLPTIQAILKKFPKAKYFVPLGNQSWFAALGIPTDHIVELDWWEEREFSLQDFGYSYADSISQSTGEKRSQETKIKFTCVPAQHNSARSPLDQGNTLWCGWVVEQLLISKDSNPDPDPSPTSTDADITTKTQTQRKGTIYHAGDTGYRPLSTSTTTCPIFTEIGQKFGPIDLSFLPIWRGGSLSFFSTLGLRLSHKDIPSALHASPADAIDIHVDVRSRNSVGVHFGTFVGSENESLEPILEFEEAREERGVAPLKVGGSAGKTRAGVVDIGGSVAVKIR
ncbi:Metallo-hydrolase/oxidoreductase [Cadophora sp. DSE1049]|nr:Metallo-hydrolase/oxidoreductase [Cadophora sp. DSE1049]